MYCSSCAVTCRPGEGVHTVQSFPSRSFLVDSSLVSLSFTLRNSHSNSHQRLSCPAPDVIQKPDKNSLFSVSYQSITVSVFLCIFFIYLWVVGWREVLQSLWMCVNVPKKEGQRVNVLSLPVQANSVLIFMLLRGLFPVYRQIWQWSISYCLHVCNRVFVFCCFCMCGFVHMLVDH